MKSLSPYLKSSFNFILVIFFCCSSPEKKSLINFSIPTNNYKELNITTISDSIKYISLETKPESLIVLIQDLIYFENKFYILDFQGKVLVFDEKGKFLYQLGSKGEGPGEFYNLNSFAIDKERKELYLSSYNRLIKYTLTNQFIEEKKFPFSIEYIHWYDNHIHIIGGEDGKKVGNQFINQRLLFKINPNLALLDSFPIFKIKLDLELGATFPYKNYISIINSDKFIYVPSLINEKIIRDTVFKVQNDTIIPWFKLKFTDPHFDNEGNKLILIKNVVTSKSYILCEYDYNGESYQFISHREEDKSFNLKEGFSIGINEKVVIRPFDLKNDIFYFILASSHNQNSSEEQNPTIGIVKF